MNRRHLFKLGVGAALAPVAAKLIPECMIVQKMDVPGRHYHQYLMPDDLIEVRSGVSYNVVFAFCAPPDSTTRVRILADQLENRPIQAAVDYINYEDLVATV